MRFTVHFLCLKAWQNEKLAPDLLECKSEIVSCVMELIAEMEKNIQSAAKGSLKVRCPKLTNE